MSRLALTVGGAILGGIIGSFIPGVGTVMGAQLGALLGSLLGALLFPASATELNGPRLNDLKIQQSEYGTPIPWIWGAWRLAGNVIWATDLVEVVTVERQGGKGGGGGTKVSVYTYFSSFAIMFCVGPIEEVTKMWANKKLIYDLEGGVEVGGEVGEEEEPETVVNRYEDEITFYTGETDQNPDPTMEADKGSGKVPGYRERVYIVFDNFPLEDYGNQMPQIEIEVSSSATPVTLQFIIDELTAKVSIPAECVDTTDLMSIIVRGFAASRVAPARAFIDTLRGPFFFDVHETEGILKFRRRGGSPIKTLTDIDLGGTSGPNSQEFLITDVRTQEIELPEILIITYPDVTLDHQSNTANLKRNQVSTPTVNEFSVEMPVLMTPDEAIAVATRTMYTTWANRIAYTWATLVEHIDLDPTDIVTVIADGISYEIMITKINMGANNLLQFEGISNDIESHVVDGNLIGGIGDGFRPGVIPQPGEITVQIIDVALLRNLDDDFFIYVAVTGEDFINASVWKSLNGEIFSTPVVVPVEAVMGISEGALLDYQCFGMWDEHASIDAIVNEGKTLDNATKLDIYNGLNIALVGDEVIGYRNATLIGTDKYRLTGLLRGVRGTGWAASSHVAGERFVALKLDLSISLLGFQSADVGRTIYIKGVEFGGELEDTDPLTFEFMSKNLWPLSPVNIRGTWDGSDNLTVTWVRRARVDTGWADFGDLEHDEPTEDYVMDVYQSDGTTFLRTITLVASAAGSVITPLSQTGYYDNVDQTADGITAGDDVTIKVYQISSRVGRGHDGTRLLTRAAFVSNPNHGMVVPFGQMTLSTSAPDSVSTFNMPPARLILTSHAPTMFRTGGDVINATLTLTTYAPIVTTTDIPIDVPSAFLELEPWPPIVEVTTD